MPFNLIMPRKVFTAVNNLCDEYETKFHEHVATARMVNVLLAEALMVRGLVPKDYIESQYGHLAPIEFGFTPAARKENAMEKMKEESDIEKWERSFSLALQQWPTMKFKSKLWYYRKALENKDRVKNAEMILALGEVKEDDNETEG